MIRSTLILTQYILLKNLYKPECIGAFHGISVFHTRLMELHGITIVFEVLWSASWKSWIMGLWDRLRRLRPPFSQTNLCLGDLRTAARKALQPTKGMIDNDVAWAFRVSHVSRTLRRHRTLKIFQQTCWHQAAHKSAGYWNHTLWVALAIWVQSERHQSKVNNLKLSKEPPRLSACSLLAGWWNRYVQSSLQTYFMIMRSLLRCSHRPHHQCGKETPRHHGT